LFGLLKEKLTAHKRSRAEQIIEAITAIWDSVTFEEPQRVFAEWIQRLTWVIDERGKHYTS
jgi:hypothetical protein